MSRLNNSSLRASWTESVSTNEELDSPGKSPMQVIVSVRGELQGAKIDHVDPTSLPQRQRNISQGSDLLSDEMLALDTAVPLVHLGADHLVDEPTRQLKNRQSS